MQYAKKKIGRVGGLSLSCAFMLVMGMQNAFPAVSSEAEIVSVVGKGDKRETAQADWTPAAPRQHVKGGGFVRTRELSQMAVLLPDRTQLRLNQNSQLQIKTLSDSAEWQQSAVKLNSGRAWSQARPATKPNEASAPPARLTMETPSATLSIRGTDWEVEVAPDGRTELVVLSGVVDMANEQGALRVGAGEAAAAEIGKAPVRLMLANPADRVQWVTAWEPRPQRWIRSSSGELAKAVALIEARDYAAALKIIEALPASSERDLLSADVAVMQGETVLAIGLLAPHAQEGRGVPLASALLARVHLTNGDNASARSILTAATATHPNEVELWLALADLEIFDGNADHARTALERALALSADNPDALYTRGIIETERENFRAGRRALIGAITRRPDFNRAIAELATLETLAGDYGSASKRYESALSATPDDYVALTGRGILKLKTGDAEGALTDFLRAGVVEPRFGRAWLYSAVAFYRLGEVARARQALDKAIRLDPHDPLPHVMLSLIAADALDLGGAIDAAQAAQERWPFLKSLNQLLNNQKGSANIGSSLAALGMEEWAHHLANQAYSPWWAGSHLFLADRYAPGFDKNSELFKGFITDPLVFGASPRRSSLVPTPGHYGRIDLFMEQSDWRQDALIGTANGMVVTPSPLAYFISGDVSQGHSRMTEDEADGRNVTIGLGMRPTDAIGIFVFDTETRIPGNLKNPTLPNDSLKIDDSRFDVGINLRWDSHNQFWLKAGSGRQSARVDGTVSVQGFGVVPLIFFGTHIVQDDMQFRHAFSPIEGAWLSWGYEDSRQDKPAAFDLFPLPAVRFVVDEQNRLHSEDIYLALRLPLLDAIQGEVAIFEQRARARQDANVRINGALAGAPTNVRRDFDETNLRGGVQWQFAPRSTLTAVHQEWRRPAAVSTLSPVDTLGIELNDRVTTDGGLYRRNRIQVDFEAGMSVFVKGFVDDEAIRNIQSPSTAVVPDLDLDQLVSLRNRRDAFEAQPELEQAPAFLEGKVRSYGVSGNTRVTRDFALSGGFRRASARQTGTRDGLSIPFYSRDFARLGAYWSLPQRLLLGATATWRGTRFRDEANTAAQRIDAGWSFGFTAYWESADKHWILQGILDNLQDNHSRSDERAAKTIVRASYLF